MKKALVCGAGGFIGGYLVDRLKQEGYWVRGVDIKTHEWRPTQADEFVFLDLRERENCLDALAVDGGFDEVYQLAANMGGVWYIQHAERDIMYDSTLINLNMSHLAIGAFEVPRYFFSSSACVYRDMQPGTAELTEDDAYPAYPANEYGWEKLYAERMAMCFGRHSDTKVRIARFQTNYGLGESWTGGREKAPPAMCRKIAEAEDGGTIQIWGDGSAVRAFIYVTDTVDGIYRLMQSDLEGPTTIGGKEVTIRELVETVAEVAGKEIHIETTPGPVGVAARYFSKARIRSLGWEARVSLREGIGYTYPWIEEQVRRGA